MKGLEGDLEEAKILGLLQKENLSINKVIRMNTAFSNHLVTTSNKVDLEKIKTVGHVRVRWEKHINKKLVIQCHQCQRWVHAQSNCSMSPRCLKCATLLSLTEKIGLASSSENTSKLITMYYIKN